MPARSRSNTVVSYGTDGDESDRRTELARTPEPEPAPQPAPEATTTPPETEPVRTRPSSARTLAKQTSQHVVKATASSSSVLEGEDPTSANTVKGAKALARALAEEVRAEIAHLTRIIEQAAANAEAARKGVVTVRKRVESAEKKHDEQQTLVRELQLKVNLRKRREQQEGGYESDDGESDVESVPDPQVGERRRAPDAADNERPSKRAWVEEVEDEGDSQPAAQPAPSSARKAEKARRRSPSLELVEREAKRPRTVPLQQRMSSPARNSRPTEHRSRPAPRPTLTPGASGSRAPPPRSSRPLPPPSRSRPSRGQHVRGGAMRTHGRLIPASPPKLHGDNALEIGGPAFPWRRDTHIQIREFCDEIMGTYDDVWAPAPFYVSDAADGYVTARFNSSQDAKDFDYLFNIWAPSVYPRATARPL